MASVKDEFKDAIDIVTNVARELNKSEYTATDKSLINASVLNDDQVSEEVMLDLDDDEDEIQGDQIVLNAMLANISISEDGGYLVVFDIPEIEKQQVSRLIALNKKTFILAVV